MERNIEIVSVELIRPLSPTPNHLRCFEFSLLDQMAVDMSVPLALFYPTPLDGSESSRLLLLKKSLSEILARFYPFAGRIKDNSVECNDDGVPFYEAFAHNYRLEDVLRKPAYVNQKFLPTTVEEGSLMPDSALYPLLVQVTIFECGGMAIGIRASHKVADCATLCTLINAWSTIARGNIEVVVPEFVAAAKFLPPPIPHVQPKPINFDVRKILFDKKLVAKFIAFDASTITSLKAKAVSDSVQMPTRVEVVSAVIWKCAMVASGNETRLSKLGHNVNIRKRLVPPLPNHCVGNVVTPATARKGENDVSDLPTLVACIRKALSEISSKYMDYKQSRDEAILAIPYDTAEFFAARFRGEIDTHIISLCSYQFYDVDFGWGKPSWVSLIRDFGIGTVVLMDSRDSGGVDAWVYLKDEDNMLVFEQELQLLAFGSAK
ncbi:vinorine synthase-like [Nicotiana sylvestris]|uniref:Vinorine synthase-like n=1 Tax=Nicotiana sylvestris TaxID=4096 RepID=A0A1U7WF38_NICSY|nr:PREDICTED: vinorine synthase-like [Nicotiana sylvestris]XP_016484134.1 PREDICTED: vinorine synthase-like [Nicotiana tabacum]